jgi:hypothetical protein
VSATLSRVPRFSSSISGRSRTKSSRATFILGSSVKSMMEAKASTRNFGQEA